MQTLPEKKDWHSIPPEEVTEEFATSKDGLAPDEAEERRKHYGENVLESQGRESVWKILFRQLHNPLIYILLGATVLAVVMGKIADGVVVMAVIVINTIIGFIQEYQAGNTIQALLDLVPEKVTVMRDGSERHIPSSELVPGDYVLLQAGDKVPADIRLTFAKNVTSDESILTGESVPSPKATESADAGSDVADRQSMLFSGALVSAGTAEGVVVGTGMHTEIGKISDLLKSTASVKSPMTRSLEKVARAITYAVIAAAVIIFGIGMIRGYEVVDALLSAITLAVAAVPEGLPAVVTISAAIGVSRMAERKAIIRHLPSVETLGSTTVICSDKTGTLTRNEMTVHGMWDGESHYRVSGEGIEPDGKIVKEDGEEEVPEGEPEELIRAGALCNDASLCEEPDGGWKAVGDPTEVAMVVAVRKAGNDEGALRKQYKRLDEKPFDSESKIMATLHDIEGKHVVYIKGAPEAVIPLLSDGDGTGPDKVKEQAQKFAEEGMRVLAFATKEFSEGQSGISEDDLKDLEFLGLMAMSDPPRTEVKDAIETCHKAGIEIKMITGDHPSTAAAIGRELGLKNADKPVTGKELQDLDKEELKDLVASRNIFARVSPEDKLRLVEGLQDHGEVVAMTGDGVNDAPALKKADIGVAMGISGTSVAKEAADMILANDNFESIEAAVEEGRRVFDNLLKCIVFLLPTSIGLGLVIVAAVLFFPSGNGAHLSPMQPVQALWINLITAVALTLPLALEAMEPDVMNRPPRKPGKPLLGGFVLFRIAVVSVIMAAGTIGLFMWEYQRELDGGADRQLAVSEAQTMAVTGMVLFQVFYLINCRSLSYSVLRIGFFSNLSVYAGIAGVLLAQAAFVYLPFMNRVFHSSPLPAEAWGVSALVAFSILIIIGIEKWVRRRRKTNDH